MLFCRVVMIQDGELLPLMDWVASEEKMRKLYKPEVVGDWSGLMWYSNGTTVPRDSPICGWNNELCQEDDGNRKMTLIFMMVGVVVILVVIICVILAINKSRYETALKEVRILIVKWKDVRIQYSRMLDNISDTSNKEEDDEMMYMGMHVVCYPLNERGVDIHNREILVELKNIRELKFENISPFVGICNDTPNVCLLMELPTRGNLKNILQRYSKLDWEIKVSIMNDLACGMSYLHLSSVGVHGRLNSKVCLLDSRWTAKVSGYGFITSRVHISELAGEQLLWTAPEMLRNMTNITSNVDCLRKADVYSFGIIGHEIILQSLPYNMDILDIHSQAIVEQVTQGKTPPFRPYIPDRSCRQEWADLLIRCWQEDPNARPAFKQVLGTIYENTKGRSISVVDRMIHRLEKYTNTLEEHVAERAIELQEEKCKVEIILSELLPTSVAEELACGNRVEPEVFDCVTVYLSDIVGFTRIAAECSAIEIVQMLNNMSAMFDDIAHEFDVYKVATIGDAYMVASGVPIRNGDNHATEVCNMALGLVKAVQEIPVPHVINTYLSMRVGIHSGTCVAAVVGVKMPRYLLFGDTVDIAARLESSGQSMKIHVSSPTVNLLHDSHFFHIERAGGLTCKDKENLETFWFSKTE